MSGSRRASAERGVPRRGASGGFRFLGPPRWRLRVIRLNGHQSGASSPAAQRAARPRSRRVLRRRRSGTPRRSTAWARRSARGGGQASSPVGQLAVLGRRRVSRAHLNFGQSHGRQQRDRRMLLIVADPDAVVERTRGGRRGARSARSAKSTAGDSGGSSTHVRPPLGDRGPADSLAAGRPRLNRGVARVEASSTASPTRHGARLAHFVPADPAGQQVPSIRHSAAIARDRIQSVSRSRMPALGVELRDHAPPDVSARDHRRMTPITQRPPEPIVLLVQPRAVLISSSIRAAVRRSAGRGQRSLRSPRSRSRVRSSIIGPSGAAVDRRPWPRRAGPAAPRRTPRGRPSTIRPPRRRRPSTRRTARFEAAAGLHDAGHDGDPRPESCSESERSASGDSRRRPPAAEPEPLRR